MLYDPALLTGPAPLPSPSLSDPILRLMTNEHSGLQKYSGNCCLANFTKANNTSSSQAYSYFSQFFGEPIACDAGEVSTPSLSLKLMTMLSLFTGQWWYRAGGAWRLLLDVQQLEHSPGVQGGLHWGRPGNVNMWVRGSRRGSLIINTFLLTRCITAYVPSTIETNFILYILCVFCKNQKTKIYFCSDQEVTIHQAAAFFTFYLKLQHVKYTLS